MSKTLDFLREVAGFTKKQMEATQIADRKRFTFFGGTRGPGKSYWLRWYFLWRHLCLAQSGIRNVRTMLACEDYPALYERQISKIVEEFPPWLGWYHDGHKEFRLYPDYGGGAICLRNLDDPSKYGSAEFAEIGVDELTMHRSRKVFDRLRGSLRWPGVDNPGFAAAGMATGVGVPWVRGLWIEREFPHEYYTAGITDEFAFVSAIPSDNEHLPESYYRDLLSQPPVLQKAWLHGDWYSGVEGAIYPDWSSAVGGNVTEDADYKDGWGDVEWWCDDGFSGEHPFYAGLVQVNTDGRINLFWEYMESYKQHDAIVEFLSDLPYPSPEIVRIPSEAGRLAQVLHAAGLRTAMSTHSIEEGVRVLRARICDGHGNRLFRVHPRCRMTIQSIAALPEDPARQGRPLKVNGVPGDHPADAARYGWWSRRSG